MTELVNHGVDVFRINTAHGKIPDFERIVATIKKVRATTGFPIGVLLDLAGPKIRLGQLAQDPLEVEAGQELTIVRGEKSTDPNQLCSNYAPLIDEVAVGNQIMLADGTITLQVTSRTRDVITCKVVTAGTIRSRQGINLPGVRSERLSHASRRY